MKRIGNFFDQIADRGTFSLAVNRAACGKRRRPEVKKFLSRLDEQIDVPAPEPDRPAEAPEIPQKLLSPKQKLILRMIYEDGMPVAEVAESLAIDPQTVRSQRHKALSRLREHFGVSAKSRGP